jgi:D-alanyl-lipoteichoic acid acyltransferase DltB (MBOAT superfamily)
LLIEKNKTKPGKRTWLLVGIFTSIGVLSYFKYFNFFIDSLINLLDLVGFSIQKPILNIILPLGISFYIFLSISYIFDIYRNKLKACTNVVDVLLALGFFPIILAGPIHRPISLLAQIQRRRTFDYSLATDGLKQILWGLFMKIVIADRCAILVNDIFQNFSNYNGSKLFFGGLLFTVQIYADFAGYSLIAIGTAKLLGFELIKNFNYPYFATNIADFWKRWHISLTSWFRDYVFIPIAYSVSRMIPSEKVWFIKTDYLIYAIGISITWFFTGLWHGANSTFILWGLMNGFLLIVYRISSKPLKRLAKNMKVSKNNIFMISFERIIIILVIIFSWIVFRAENIGHAISFISQIFSPSFFSWPKFSDPLDVYITLLFICIFMVVEWLGREQHHAIANIGTKWNRILRYSFYYAILMAIIWLGGNEVQFIYFQF